jgi:hypothetical protein
MCWRAPALRAATQQQPQRSGHAPARPRTSTHLLRERPHLAVVQPVQVGVLHPHPPAKRAAMQLVLQARRRNGRESAGKGGENACWADAAGATASMRGAACGRQAGMPRMHTPSNHLPLKLWRDRQHDAHHAARDGVQRGSQAQRGERRGAALDLVACAFVVCVVCGGCLCVRVCVAQCAAETTRQGAKRGTHSLHTHTHMHTRVCGNAPAAGCRRNAPISPAPMSASRSSVRPLSSSLNSSSGDSSASSCRRGCASGHRRSSRDWPCVCVCVACVCVWWGEAQSERRL